MFNFALQDLQGHSEAAGTQLSNQPQQSIFLGILLRNLVCACQILEFSQQSTEPNPDTSWPVSFHSTQQV